MSGRFLRRSTRDRSAASESRAREEEVRSQNRGVGRPKNPERPRGKRGRPKGTGRGRVVILRDNKDNKPLQSEVNEEQDEAIYEAPVDETRLDQSNPGFILDETNYAHFKARIGPSNPSYEYIRWIFTMGSKYAKEDKDEAPTSCLDLLTKQSFQLAWKVVRELGSLYPLYYHPQDKGSIQKTLESRNGVFLKKLGKNKTFQSMHDPSRELPSGLTDANFNKTFKAFKAGDALETLKEEDVMKDVYFFDMEFHVFAFTPYAREIACLSLDGTRGFCSPVHFITDIDASYAEVRKLDQNVLDFEKKFGNGALHANDNPLQQEMSDEATAPSFATAFGLLLQFIKPDVAGRTPLLIFQGNTDPTSLVFNLLQQSFVGSGSMPTKEAQDELLEQLADVKPRFISSLTFFHNMQRTFSMPNFAKKTSLQWFTAKLFFPKSKKKLRDRTSDINVNMKNEYQHLLAVFDKSLVSPTPDRIEPNPFSAFSMDYLIEEGDVEHHTATSDCMILRNVMLALVLFHLFLSRFPDSFTTYLLTLLEDGLLSDQPEYVGENGRRSSELYILKRLLNIKEDAPEFKDCADYKDRFTVRFEEMFGAFMQTLVDHTDKFKKHHLPVDRHSATMLLTLMGLGRMTEDLSPVVARRLETWSPDPLIERYNKEKNKAYDFVATNKSDLERFFSTIERGQGYKVSKTPPSNKPRYLKLIEDTKEGAYDRTFVHSLASHYYGLNASLGREKLTLPKLMEDVVYARRNWPLFFHPKDGLSRKLHHRFCPSLFDSIKLEAITHNSEEEEAEAEDEEDEDGEPKKQKKKPEQKDLRFYRNVQTIRGMHIFQNTQRHTGPYGEVGFCKRCKRFSVNSNHNDAFGYDLRHLIDIDVDQSFKDWSDNYPELFRENFYHSRSNRHLSEVQDDYDSVPIAVKIEDAEKATMVRRSRAFSDDESTDEEGASATLAIDLTYSEEEEEEEEEDGPSNYSPREYSPHRSPSPVREHLVSFQSPSKHRAPVRHTSSGFIDVTSSRVKREITEPDIELCEPLVALNLALLYRQKTPWLLFWQDENKEDVKEWTRSLLGVVAYLRNDLKTWNAYNVGICVELAKYTVLMTPIGDHKGVGVLLPTYTFVDFLLSHMQRTKHLLAIPYDVIRTLEACVVSRSLMERIWIKVASLEKLQQLLKGGPMAPLMVGWFKSGLSI